MPMAAITAYMGELPGLLAEWRIVACEAALMPHYKESARRRLQREMKELAYGDDGPQRITASPRMLAMIGIGVVRAE